MIVVENYIRKVAEKSPSRREMSATQRALLFRSFTARLGGYVKVCEKEHQHPTSEPLF